MKFIIDSLDNLNLFSSVLSKFFKPGFIMLEGELGAGKTTLLSYFVKNLTGKEVVSSPTFTLANKYEGPPPIYHLDLYRINSEIDLYNMDIEYYLNKKDHLVCVEWAEKLESFYPESCLKINIHFKNSDQRLFEITGIGEKYQEIEKKLEAAIKDIFI
jgi:tRNA threonylcarbamoyladenosine biosynthesis protein TsaE